MITLSVKSLRTYLLALVLTAFILPCTSIAAEVVNINKADAATMIANWKGIGEKKARAIVSYRKKNGAFKSLDDLMNVKGIGEGLIKKNKRYMSITGGARSTAKAKPTTKKKAKPSSKKKSTSKKTTTKKPSTKKSTGKSTTKKKSGSSKTKKPKKPKANT